MAKRKGVQQRKPQPHTNQEWRKLVPRIRKHFAAEIEQEIAQVPADLWKNSDICGVLYDFLPWHEHSLISIQLQDDDPTDVGGWEHYEPITPDGRLLTEEFELYAQVNDGLVYHRLLIEAADALLGIDFTRFGLPEAINEERMNPGFKLQVYHGDERYKFNYCEYVLARRLEQMA